MKLKNMIIQRTSGTADTYIITLTQVSYTNK